MGDANLRIFRLKIPVTRWSFRCFTKLRLLFRLLHSALKVTSETGVQIRFVATWLFRG